MPIITLNQIKEVEALIASMTTKTISLISNRINEIELTVGSYIADQLRKAQWTQARAMGFI